LYNKSAHKLPEEQQSTKTTTMDDSVSTQSYSQNDLPELLNQYYKRLFPYKLYYKWLSYGSVPKNYFSMREFSFTLKDDVYIRYLSFADDHELEKEMQKRLPYKIDIGAVYNCKPKDHKTVQPGAFRAEEKELVFDIDMTDYDEVRACCSGAAICKKCWPLMITALKILDKALQEDFGFDHRLWVYSGRRGIHCWVGDEAARKLSQTGRSAVAEYLSVIKGGESQTKKVNFKGSMHPSLRRASEFVEKYFTSRFIKEQGILDSDEGRQAMLKLLPEGSLRDKVEQAWNSNCSTTEDRWKKLVYCVNEKFNGKNLLEEIMFQYVYPRLDINVSKGLNHLLKSPFCIHPKTGRVCVPIDPARAEEFDPFTVPTISELINELDEYAKNNNENEDDTPKPKREYMKTSLAKSMKIFERFLSGLEKENNERRRIENEKQAQTGQW